jgi:hypothetical protein
LFPKLRLVRFGKVNQDAVLRGHCVNLPCDRLAASNAIKTQTMLCVMWLA